MSTSPAHRASSLNLKRAFLGVTLGFVFLAILIMVLGATSYQLSRTGSVRSAELSERLLPALEALAGVQEARALQHVQNVVPVKGLEYHIVRLHLKCLHGKARVRGDEHDDDVPPDLAKAHRKLDAVHAGHVDIQHRKLHLVCARVGNCVFG